MYRTILLALPALLLLAACADDVTPPAGDPATLAGQPVRFTATGLAITPADAPRTRAEGDTETDFPAEGSTMTVYMTGNGLSQQADYTYSTANGWTSTAPPALARHAEHLHLHRHQPRGHGHREYDPAHGVDGGQHRGLRRDTRHRRGEDDHGHAKP